MLKELGCVVKKKKSNKARKQCFKVKQIKVS